MMLSYASIGFGSDGREVVDHAVDHVPDAEQIEQEDLKTKKELQAERRQRDNILGSRTIPEDTGVGKSVSESVKTDTQSLSLFKRVTNAVGNRAAQVRDAVTRGRDQAASAIKEGLGLDQGISLADHARAWADHVTKPVRESIFGHVGGRARDMVVDAGRTINAHVQMATDFVKNIGKGGMPADAVARSSVHDDEGGEAMQGVASEKNNE